MAAQLLALGVEVVFVVFHNVVGRTGGEDLLLQLSDLCLCVLELFP